MSCIIGVRLALRPSACAHSVRPTLQAGKFPGWWP